MPFATSSRSGFLAQGNPLVYKNRDAVRLAGVATAGILALLPISSWAADTPSGRVVLASAGESALLIWDASERIATLGGEGVGPTAALRELEVDAVTIAAREVRGIRRSREVTVRVMKRGDAAANEKYGAATYSSFSQIARVTVSTATLLRDLSKLKKSIRAGRPSSGVRVTAAETAY